MTVEEYAKAKCARKMRERYDRLVAEHRCVSCTGQDERTLAGHTRCASCYAKAYKNPQVVTEDDLKRYAANRQAKKNRFKALGRCHDCGEVDYRVSRGNKLCARCQRRRDKKQEAYRQSGQQSQWQRDRRERFRAAGMCTKCGKNPPEEGRQYCTDCLVRGRMYKRRARIKKEGRT